MRTGLVTLLAILMGATAAMAQTPPPPPPGGPGASGGPGSGMESRMPMQGGPRAGMEGPPPPHGMMRMPPPSKAGHFRFETGDLRVDVKCADDEPMKVCADLAGQMIDKLVALGRR